MTQSTKVSSPNDTRRETFHTEVAVIGDGVIGLSTAYELGRLGVSCYLVGARREGFASGAAAGLLAPSTGSLTGAVQVFFDASLDRYPEFLAPLQEIDPHLQLLRGLVQVVDDSAQSANRSFVSAAALTAIEPGLVAPHGAILHERDAALDNVRLVEALRRAVARHSTTHYLRDDPVVAVDAHAGRVTLASGSEVTAERIVLAAGAWSREIAGIARELPVSPLKGQMLAVASTAVKRPIMGNSVYIVPRAGELVIGATVEHAGFDLTTSDAAIESLRAASARLVPEIAGAPVTRRWAGIRPATPDMLPIIGTEPMAPRLIYACGHSKNGILLAPVTAAAVASLARQTTPEFDLAPFSPARFD